MNPIHHIYQHALELQIMPGDCEPSPEQDLAIRRRVLQQEIRLAWYYRHRNPVIAWQHIVHAKRDREEIRKLS